MEFVDGVKLEELGTIPDVRPDLVADFLDSAFSQMIFVDGFVHGDPHTGNILVRECASSRMFFRKAPRYLRTGGVGGRRQIPLRDRPARAPHLRSTPPRVISALGTLNVAAVDLLAHAPRRGR